MVYLGSTELVHGQQIPKKYFVDSEAFQSNWSEEYY